MLRDNISQDVQKFIGTLHMVIDSHPTGGVSLKDTDFMAIAIHLYLAKKVDYDFCEGKYRAFNPAERWVNYLSFLELKEHPKFYSEGDGVFNNKNGSVQKQTETSMVSDDGKIVLEDDSKEETIMTSSISNGSHATAGMHAYVSQKRAKAEMKNRSEEKVLLKKVTELCDNMNCSQHKISVLIDLVAKQECERNNRNKEKQMKNILMLYKMKYREAKRLSDDTTSSFMRQKINMIREELLLFMETNLVNIDKEINNNNGNLVAKFNGIKHEVVCIDDENKTIVECIDVNEEFVSPLNSVEMNEADKISNKKLR